MDYLRANRATFINTEFCIQIPNTHGKTDEFLKGNHWFCDIVALNFATKQIMLCEVTTAQDPAPLRKRLKAWSAKWEILQTAVKKIAHLDDVFFHSWSVVPRVFVPKARIESLRLWETQAALGFQIEYTALEDTPPWEYPWIREANTGDIANKANVPLEPSRISESPIPCDN